MVGTFGDTIKCTFAGAVRANHTVQKSYSTGFAEFLSMARAIHSYSAGSAELRGCQYTVLTGNAAAECKFLGFY